ncbi:MAG: restriction endonuclease [Candidatus Altiarchaeota archaeon]|nr:restriction endonuclease [Candidatus Altiarchaeota archaeon]
MNLVWDTSGIFRQYKSNSQRIRCLSEKWFTDEMFCPACSSEELEPYSAGNPVADFHCPGCDEEYQLKSQGKALTGRVNDGAYGKMIEAVRNETQPNFFLLRYDPVKWRVADLVAVPRFFFTESVIEKRKPLTAGARRSGWIGCNILLSAIPQDGRIPVVWNNHPLKKKEVRSLWKKTAFLKEKKAAKRSWIVDVMRCIRELKKDSFTLDEIYACEDFLQKLHPENRNIRPKIRQQLQFLRDKGYLSFIERGRYELVK